MRRIVPRRGDGVNSRRERVDNRRAATEMTGVAGQPNERRERVPARRLGRVPWQTLAGVVVGAIVAGALLMFSAPAKAAQPNHGPCVVAPASTR
jgi:hypothetical protein